MTQSTTPAPLPQPAAKASPSFSRSSPSIWAPRRAGRCAMTAAGFCMARPNSGPRASKAAACATCASALARRDAGRSPAASMPSTSKRCAGTSAPTPHMSTADCLATLTAWCEEQSIPYSGVPVGTMETSRLRQGQCRQAGGDCRHARARLRTCRRQRGRCHRHPALGHRDQGRSRMTTPPKCS